MSARTRSCARHGQMYDLTIPDVSGDNTNASGDLDRSTPRTCASPRPERRRRPSTPTADGRSVATPRPTTARFDMVNASVTLDNLRITDGSTTTTPSTVGRRLQGRRPDDHQRDVNAIARRSVAGASGSTPRRHHRQPIHSNTGGDDGAIWMTTGPRRLGSTITGNSAMARPWRPPGWERPCSSAAAIGRATLRDHHRARHTANAYDGRYGLGHMTLGALDTTSDADRADRFAATAAAYVVPNMPTELIGARA